MAADAVATKTKNQGVRNLADIKAAEFKTFKAEVLKQILAGETSLDKAAKLLNYNVGSVRRMLKVARGY